MSTVPTVRVLGLAWLLAAGVAAAQVAGDPTRHKSTGPVVMLPPPVGDQPDRLTLPGREYRAGDGWWALACAPACTLQAMRLEVEPVAEGQRLRFVPAPRTGTRLIFKPLRLPALKPAAGPVTTWHPGTALRPRRATPATMEAELSLPDGSSLVLAPVLLTEASVSTLVLELRAEGWRQRVGPFEFGADGEQPVPPEAVLRWAGDLDGDGRTDLLVDLGAGGAQDLRLLLSSQARNGQRFGEAGRYRQPWDLVR